MLSAAAVLGIVLAATAPTTATAVADDGPTAALSAGDRGTFLVAADPEAAALHVFRASTLQRTGSLADLKVDVHAGTVALPDGRLLLVDEKANIDQVRIDATGRPRLERSVAIPTGDRRWEGAAWAAVDPSLRYFGVTSGYSDSPDQTLTVLDTQTFRAFQLPVEVDEVDGGFTEVQVTFGGGDRRRWRLPDLPAGRRPRGQDAQGDQHLPAR